ncbi:flagellar basal body rod protein FlgC [Tropicimonas isoalkanivorans]|uniref:Flagellar basal body rod protein FlgB n=1 Tax=Tropicimonas isoalkanivorans TaxID=441112 RepID=A0A1I1PJS6_9RHOB|nr:flagellar basal body rod protein FlgC [Tropicimonas isoalkanivorans]SFD10074.1 flagellar basal-body rod protein FlgC [Tropicimonas isoalkanivorans]
MSDLMQSLAVSASGMRGQATRLRHVSENIANVDTPGYRRKITSFETELASGERAGLLRNGPVTLDQTEATRIFDPAHPMADESGYYDGSNVDLLVEVADAREAQRSYEANLKMFDQARQMTLSLLELMRK